MARLVCIAAGTYLPGKNNIGDVVSIHDDGWKPGPAYSTFSIVDVPGLTAHQAWIELEKKIPSDFWKDWEEDPTSGKLPTREEQKYQDPTYQFRVSNPLGATIADKCATNVTLKV